MFWYIKKNNSIKADFSLNYHFTLYVEKRAPYIIRQKGKEKKENMLNR